MRLSKAILALLLLTVGGAALAQTSLGMILVAGARSISKGELTTLLVDKSWRAVPDPTAIVKFSSDGKFSGANGGGGSATNGLFGDWTIDADGKLCLIFRNRGGSGQPFCRYCSFKATNTSVARVQSTELRPWGQEIQGSQAMAIFNRIPLT